MTRKKTTHLFCGSEAHATLCGDWCGVHEIRKKLSSVTCRRCLFIAKAEKLSDKKHPCECCKKLHRDHEECP